MAEAIFPVAEDMAAVVIGEVVDITAEADTTEAEGIMAAEGTMAAAGEATVVGEVWALASAWVSASASVSVIPMGMDILIRHILIHPITPPTLIRPSMHNLLL